jgi:hypothetical protein
MKNKLKIKTMTTKELETKAIELVNEIKFNGYLETEHGKKIAVKLIEKFAVNYSIETLKEQQEKIEKLLK